jgi:N-acetylmuramoyl-L-alanine amidase/putative methionine-R-sulfoxide reductase with GAF domain
MSATPNNAGSEWGSSQLLPYASETETPVRVGQDALQVLLAFACIHEQTAKRRRLSPARLAAESSADEYFGLDEVLRLVALRATSITGAHGVAIALAKENAIVCRASVGNIAPDPGIHLDPNSGFSGACLRNGQPVRCDDSDADSRVNPQACRALGARSMVAVPLTAKGRVVGLIEAFSAKTHGFNDGDVKSLSLLGELILAAIHPEEEDRLAQLAERILPQPPAVVLQPGGVEKILVAPAPKVAETPSLPAEQRAKIAPVPSSVASGSVVSGSVVSSPVVPSSVVVSGSAVAASRVEQPLLEKRPAAVERLEREPLPIPTPQLTFPKEKRSAKSVLLVAALILVAVGLGWGWFHHAEQLTSASTRTQLKGPLTQGQEPGLSAQSPVKPGTNPEVTGIRHWSSPDSSTVVVDLQDQIQYEAHTLDSPPRIYFDLFDTKMAAGLLNQSITVDDGFIKRLRMAQPKSGVTRVVLETKGISEVSVKLDPNPYRLTIDVHKVPTTLPTTTLPGTLNKPSPSLSVSPKTKASHVATASESEFRVTLDAGHGGWDLGTVGRKGLLEKNLVLDVVQRLGKLIEEKLGADVVYTRQDDSYLPLEKRAQIANVSKANLFLSVHANYSDLATARGVETYYTTTYSSIKARTAEDDPTLKDVNWTTGVDIREKVTNSHRLADDVQEALFGGLAARTPEIRNRGVKEAQYVVLTGTRMPAILAEISFVSSPADEDNLQSSEYRQEIAEALYRGVAKYRAEEKHTKMASNRKLSSSE